MALVTVLIYRVTDTYDGTYTSTGGPLTYDFGDIFHVIYDTVTGAYTVEFRTTGSGPGSGSLITTALSGPQLTGTGSYEVLYPGGNGDLYKYCEGTTLWQLTASGFFPYAGKYGVVNSPYCYIAPTCDLEISNDYTQTDATGPETNDGSLSVSATSSYGVIKYGIGNFNYNTGGQTSGVFSNLLPGVYTIYAKDEAGCQDTITIEINVTEVYNVRWRLDFKDYNLHDVRLDILERAYTGDIEEVCGGDSPINITYNGDQNNIYQSIIPSECVLQLISDYPGKFESIFTADDRKYRVKVYVDSGEIIPPFVPDTLDPLEDWINVDDIGTVAWSIDSTPSVELSTGTVLMSEILSTDYAFEAGRTYSFDIEVLFTISGVPLNYPTITYYVSDISGNDLGVGDVMSRGTSGSESRNFTFVAPIGAAKLRFVARKSSPVNTTVQITSIVNQTISIPGSPVGIQLYWTGYCASEFYEEPYLKEPFTIEITAIDGLGELKNKDFLDSNENRYKDNQTILFLISEALKTTDLKLNINNSVNIYESGMASGNSDDPFTQAYVDVRIFYGEGNDSGDTPQKFDYAVSSLIEPFGAKIFQSKGEWWITRIEYSVTQSLSFRKFDYLGAYISNSIDNPLYTTNAPGASGRLAWVDRTQRRSFNRNYGSITISHDLAKDQNLIDSGSFEAEYLIEDGNGDVFFKDWSFTTGQDDQTFGLEVLEDGSGAFFNRWGENSFDNQNDSILYTKEIPFVIGLSTQIKVRFRVKVDFIRNLPYARLGWRFRARNTDTGDYSDVEYSGGIFGYTSTTNTEKINDLYIEVGDSGEWRDIEIGPFTVAPPVSGPTTYQLSFYFHNHRGFDYDDYDDMRNININYSVRRNDDQRLYFSGDLERVLYYKIDATDAPESVPDIIRPNTYNASQPRQWALQSTYYVAGDDSVVKKIMLDDVQISIYPNELSQTGGYVDPPSVANYSLTTSKLVKSTLSKPVVLGDVPTFANAKEIYRGYFRLSDGTPTESWFRKGIIEERFLLDILVNDYSTQMKDQSQKLSGTGISDSVIHYLNFFYNHIDTKRHVNTIFTYSVKRTEYTIAAVYVKTGETGEPPVTLAAFTDGFSIGLYA